MTRHAALFLMPLLACTPRDDGLVEPAAEERMVILESRVSELERRLEAGETPAPQATEPAASPNARLLIRTGGVTAHVLVAKTGDEIGVTNSNEGIELLRSDQPIDLILRAPGHEDLLFSIVPNRDKAFAKQLRRKP